MKFLFFNFLSSRGVILQQQNDNSISHLKYSLDDVKILNWNFSSFSSRFFLSNVSFLQIKNYKRKLKLIIKSYVNLHPKLLIKLLNNEIIIFNFKYNFSDDFPELASELDVYLFKLLWKWSRRRHPRRSNSWIYFKYWKFIGQSWKFFCLDNLEANPYFLKSHFIFKSSYYHLPSCLNIFDLFNESKFNKVWFKRVRKFFKGFYRVLFDNQQGLCFNCKKVFDYGSFSDLKIVDLSFFRFKTRNKLSAFVLVHKYC